MLTSAAARSKRYRARQRTGRAIVAIELADYFATVDALLEVGALGEEASQDRLQVASAIARLVEWWAQEIATRDATTTPIRGRMRHAYENEVPRDAPAITCCRSGQHSKA